MLAAGIVGLPNVGKSTLFNAVTRTRKAQAANYPFCTIDPNVGVVTVPVWIPVSAVPMLDYEWKWLGDGSDPGAGWQSTLADRRNIRRTAQLDWAG